jgi:GNAT superfamily N-acetyltransferase
VDAAFHDRGIGSLLMDAALAWAGDQSGLERLCVQVRADNLPVSQLCCKFGFAPERREAVRAIGGGELMTLACTL